MDDEYTFRFPDEAAFLNTVQSYLVIIGRSDVAMILEAAICSFGSNGSYSGLGYNRHQCTMYLVLPLKLYFTLTEALTEEIRLAANVVMPRDSGYDVTDVDISPKLEPLPSEVEGEGLNAASNGVAKTQYYQHDGLRFRSPAEVEIYKVLKRQNVLFFPNPAAILGLKGRKREPDFLVCQNGKWGILEIMGVRYHTNENAAYDHARADDFEDYGVRFIKFRPASDCLADPKGVVEEFLRRLAAS